MFIDAGEEMGGAPARGGMFVDRERLAGCAPRKGCNVYGWGCAQLIQRRCMPTINMALLAEAAALRRVSIYQHRTPPGCVPPGCVSD